jgi:hypothetical protein
MADVVWLYFLVFAALLVVKEVWCGATFTPVWCWLMVREEFHYSSDSFSDFWLYFLVFAALFAVKEVLVYWCSRWLSFIRHWCIGVQLFSGRCSANGYWWLSFGGLLCIGVLVLNIFPFLLNGIATLALYVVTFVLVFGLFVLWGVWLQGCHFGSSCYGVRVGWVWVMTFGAFAFVLSFGGGYLLLF